MSGAGAQRIRPGLTQLQADEDQEDIDWPAAAQVSRDKAPELGKANQKQKQQFDSSAKKTAAEGNSSAKKSVRIAQPSEEDVRYFEPAPRARAAPLAATSTAGPSRFRQSRVSTGEESAQSSAQARFELDLDGDEAVETESEGGDASTSSATLPMRQPMVGSVAERRPAVPTGSSADAKPGSSSGTSRFKAMRQAERDASSTDASSSRHRARPQAPPTLEPTQKGTMIGEQLATNDLPAVNPDVIGGNDQEEWLDEEGKPMSAFRKARLKRQGHSAPGGVQSRSNAANVEDDARIQGSHVVGDISAEQQPHYTDGVDDVASLMKSISKENQDKVQKMQSKDVQQDLKDLEAMFGPEVLEQLRQRSQGKSQTGALQAPKQSPNPPNLEPSNNAQTMRHNPRSSDKGSDVLGTLTFDGHGKIRAVPQKPSDLTDVSGNLDPAFADQDGYSAASLLLLARSTVAGQRTMALAILSRVCSLYGAPLAIRQAKADAIQLIPGQTPSSHVTATHLLRERWYHEVALSAVYLLSDRQISVRHAALSCLRVALLFGGLEEATRSKAEPDEEPAPKSAALEVTEAGLLNGFNYLLKGNTSEQTASRSLIVEVLLQLVEADAQVAGVLLQADQGRFLGVLLQSTLKVTWPPIKKGQDGGDQPVVRVVFLLAEVIKSSRQNAQTLIKRDTLDCLLRYFAVPPWQLDSLMTEHRTCGYEIMVTSLRLYRSLAQYGFYASLVSRAWDVLEPISTWSIERCRNQECLTKQEALVTTEFFRLLTAWTTCAEDPHQTTPDHEVTWSQVAPWAELSLDLLQAMQFKAFDDQDGPQRLQVFAAVGRHLTVWCDIAARKAPEEYRKLRSRALRVISALIGDCALEDATVGLLGTGTPDIERVDDEEEEDRLSGGELLLVGCQAAQSLIALHSLHEHQTATKTALTLAGRALLHRPVLSSLFAKADAESSALILDFIASCCLDDGTPKDQLKLLGLLQPANQRAAAHLVKTLTKRLGEANGTTFEAPVPFYLECIGLRPNPKLEAQRPLSGPVLQVQSGDLKRVTSLRSPRSSDTEVQDTEVDSITQTPLWTCPASAGLPLRPDWFLLPLDDLLRSAEATVFNRTDNLPEDWDPNERQVVAETLAFSVACIEAMLSDGADGHGLQPAHLQLAAQKVFMLESGIQGDMRKWTGAVTGKDLYRDPAIVSALRQLLLQEQRLAQLRTSDEGEVTLEDLAKSHFGDETTYYSFFTDFVGLYDSISYGDPLFARCLLPATSIRRYPADYRRLLWKDYAHLLPSIRTLTVEVSDPSSFLHPHETETDMIQAYLSALLEGHLDVSRARHELLPRVALHHLAAYLWIPDSRTEQQRASLGRLVASDRVASGLREALVSYDASRDAVAPPDEGLPRTRAEEIERRREWLQSL